MFKRKAEEFAKKWGLELKINSMCWEKWDENDTSSHATFNVSLIRVVDGKKRQMTFKWGQAVAYGDREPSMFDILVDLEKYEFTSFEEYCSEFGLECCDYKDYVKNVRIWHGLKRIFGKDLDAEIWKEFRQFQI
jgi:hypothetical protein